MTVTSSTNKVSFSGDGSTTVFAYSFKIFDQDDLTVILRSATGTETTQTITTNYTVSGVGSASGGNVTMGTAPASGTTLTILREQPLTQGLDLVANDPFPAASMEDALDKITMQVQTLDEEVGRAIKASKTNTITSTEFTVSAADRANKVFSFDGSGELAVTQELGIFKGNWAASTAYVVRDLVKDTSTNNIFIVNAAHTSSGSQPLTTNSNSSKYDLIVDAASATTSATNAATSATTSTTKASEAASSATAAASSQSAAATSATNASTSETNAASSASTASTQASNAASSATSASGSASTATTKASEASTSASNAATSASNAATSESNASTSQSAAATSATAAATSATSAATNATNAATSATNASTSETNAATSETNAATSASAAAASQTAAAASAASAATAYDSFDDRYLGTKASDPTLDNDGNALVSGALYFSSSENIMKVYDGSSWIAATSAGNVSLTTYQYTATGGQTTFSGSDDNAATLTYTVNNILVTLNGSLLFNGTDYTATNGTSIVLSSGATASDVLQITAFASFTTADMVPASTGGTFAGNVAMTGDLTVDTNTLYVDSTNNRVGIGTSLPNSPLEVSNGTENHRVALGTGEVYLMARNASSYITQEYIANQHVFTGYGDNSSNEAMRLDASGNLLVGTTNVNIRDSSTNDGLVYRTGNSLDVTNNGNTVAIFNRNTSDGDIVTFRKGAADVGSIGVYSSDNLYLQGKSDHSGLAFGEAEIYGFRNGSENDGVTSLGSSAGRFKDLYLSGQWVSNGTNNTIRASFQVSGTQYGYINVATTGTVYSTSSDYRLKENVVPLTNATERLKQLNPLRFSFIPDETSRIVDGFLAHEVQDIVPEAIIGAKDAMRDEEYEVTSAVTDDDGNVVTEAVMGTRSVPDYQGIDQSKLVPLLTAALQEALDEITDLKARVATLEAN